MRSNSVVSERPIVIQLSHACYTNPIVRFTRPLETILPLDAPLRTPRLDALLEYRQHAATCLRFSTARPEPAAPSPCASARLDRSTTAQPSSAFITKQLWIRAISRTAGGGGGSRTSVRQQHAPGVWWFHGRPHRQNGHGIRWTGHKHGTAIRGAERMFGIPTR
jgi:hypothetical protein